MDIKFQITRGAVPGDWDQRKSAGEFKGQKDGLHVRTVFEFRLEGAAAAALTDPAVLASIVQDGDNVLTILNRALAEAAKAQPPAFERLADLVGVGGSGPVEFGVYAYDND